MALSGSKNYAVTRADIIEGALRKCGVYDQGGAISGDETNAADQALNLMVKEWVARGIDIWLRDEITLFLQPDTQSYSIGTTHATASYVETTATTQISAAVTVWPITSSTGMTAADNIGLKMDSGTIHWTTIVSVDSATQVTVTTGPATSAASGKRIYAYTTKAGRPTKILSVFRRDTNGYDTEVRKIGEAEYYQQSNKSASGVPIEVWYQPTMTTGTLYVWPDGGGNVDKLVMSAQYYPDDFDAASNNPQFPVEWGNVLVWSLAAEMAAEHGLPEREQGRLWQISEFKLNEMLDYDQEQASVEFALRGR